MNAYVAYGLSFSSQIPFPNLEAYAGKKTDCAVKVGPVKLPKKADVLVSAETFSVTSSGVYLSWEDEGTFLVQGGREILVDPVPGVDIKLLRSIILGPAFATLLHERSQLVLHASAAAIEDNALLFLGISGQGKSTLVMAFHASGHRALVDDIAAVDVKGQVPMVAPGYPQINVVPNDLMTQDLGWDNPAREPQPQKKQAILVSKHFSRVRLPIKQIYVLDEGPENVLEQMSHQEALAALLRHSYCFSMLTKPELPVHFSQCTKLIESVTIIRARIRRSFDTLPAAVQLIENAVNSDLP